MLAPEQVKEMLINIAEMYMEKQDELSKYDAVIGDGDHGVTMARGAKAAKEKLENMEGGSCKDYFKAFGRTLVSTLGGAIGPLFGSIFIELSKTCTDKELFGIDELAEGIKNAELKICDLGGAKVGDKTMVDAINPTSEELQKAKGAGKDLKEGLYVAVQAAKRGVKSTIPLMAKKGRSKYLREKSVGHQDAGATSFYYMIQAMYEYVKNI